MEFGIVCVIILVECVIIYLLLVLAHSFSAFFTTVLTQLFDDFRRCLELLIRCKVDFVELLNIFSIRTNTLPVSNFYKSSHSNVSNRNFMISY